MKEIKIKAWAILWEEDVFLAQYPKVGEDGGFSELAAATIFFKKKDAKRFIDYKTNILSDGWSAMGGKKITPCKIVIEKSKTKI